MCTPKRCQPRRRNNEQKKREEIKRKYYIRFDVLITLDINIMVFWSMKPCNPLKINRRFGGAFHLHLQGWRISQAGSVQMPVPCLAYSLNLEMGAICSSETSVVFQRTIWRYVPEDRDRALYNHRCENLKFYMTPHRFLEDGESRFLRNVNIYLRDYSTSHSRGQQTFVIKIHITLIVAAGLLSTHTRTHVSFVTIRWPCNRSV
jgi:hypothetical protein